MPNRVNNDKRNFKLHYSRDIGHEKDVGQPFPPLYHVEFNQFT